MKLLFCFKCEDIVKLLYKPSTCRCGATSGWYSMDGLHVLERENWRCSKPTPNCLPSDESMHIFKNSERSLRQSINLSHRRRVASKGSIVGLATQEEALASSLALQTETTLWHKDYSRYRFPIFPPIRRIR